jgi:hypothetical protein
MEEGGREGGNKDLSYDLRKYSKIYVEKHEKSQSESWSTD